MKSSTDSLQRFRDLALEFSFQGLGFRDLGLIRLAQEAPACGFHRPC